MAGTRAQSCEKAAGGSCTSDENLPAVDPGLSADNIEVTNQQGNMSDVVPKDLQDMQMMLLRASETSARKGLDDVTVEIEDQVAHIKAAKGRDTPEAALKQYKKLLTDLFENGDKLLTSFATKN